MSISAVEEPTHSLTPMGLDAIVHRDRDVMVEDHARNAAIYPFGQTRLGKRDEQAGNPRRDSRKTHDKKS